MRVRCDKCGTKALTAASQCPHCGHLLEIRDGFGELLPLTHCPTCDSYYPLSQGECRWCGTKPEEGVRIAPYALKGVGLLAFVGLGVGAWVASRGDDVTSRSLASTETASLTRVVDSGVASQTRAELVNVPTARASESTTVVAADTMMLDSARFDTIAPAPMAVEAAPVRGRTVVPLRTVSSPKRAVTPRRNVRWVGATARQWVTVRAAAAHSARFVASIGPDTRVQLGEARGAWRRIRTKGISGWVEHSQF